MAAKQLRWRQDVVGRRAVSAVALQRADCGLLLQPQLYVAHNPMPFEAAHENDQKFVIGSYEAG